MHEAIEVLEGLGATVKEVSLARASTSAAAVADLGLDIAAMLLKQWLRNAWHDFDVGTRTRLDAGCLRPVRLPSGHAGRALVRREVLQAWAGSTRCCPDQFNPPGRIDATKETVYSPRRSAA